MDPTKDVPQQQSESSEGALDALPEASVDRTGSAQAADPCLTKTGDIRGADFFRRWRALPVA